MKDKVKEWLFYLAIGLAVGSVAAGSVILICSMLGKQIAQAPKRLKPVPAYAPFDNVDTAVEGFTNRALYPLNASEN